MFARFHDLTRVLPAFRTNIRWHLDFKCFSSSTQKLQREGVRYLPFIPNHAISGNKLHKNVMVIGGTGTGKTSSINTSVNYLFGAEYEDIPKYLIEEQQKKEGQAVSQTDAVTLYYLEPTEIDYTIAIYDTPGFNDTRKCDDEHVAKLKMRFNEMQTIDAILFVIQSSDMRLNDGLKYVFDKVLELFGHDIAQNIFILFTFGATDNPPAIDALKKDNVPYKKYFCIDNSAFFGIEPDEYHSDAHLSKREKRKKYGDTLMKHGIWTKTMCELEELFETIKNVEPQSLSLTKEVLRERELLKNYLKEIPAIRINHALNLLNNINETMEEIKNCEKEIESNQNYQFVRAKKRISKNKTTAWSCVNDDTQTTCYRDTVAVSAYWCHCMYWNGDCSICGNKYDSHKLVQYTYDVETYYAKETRQDIYDRYYNAKQKKSAVQQVLDGLQEEYNGACQTLLGDISELCRCCNRLNEIALRGNIKSPLEYIDDMIENEMNNKNDGYYQRVKTLEEIKKFLVQTATQSISK